MPAFAAVEGREEMEARNSQRVKIFVELIFGN